MRNAALQLGLLVLALAGQPRMASASAISIRTEVLPPAVVGRHYSTVVRTAGGVSCLPSDRNITIDGDLPPGLRLTIDGIEGVPETIGRWPIRVTVFNSCSSVQKQFVVDVRARPILSVSAPELTFRVRKDGTSQKTFLVKANWENLDYRLLTERNAWLRLSGEAGRTPMAHSAMTGDVVQVAVDATRLAPGAYRDRIRVVSAGSANIAEVAVSLIVE